MKKILISGTMSGSGKTTVSSILMSALENVAPFKVGPDYIDPTHHEVFTGHHSHNLDIFMTGEDAVRQIFEMYSQGRDISIVEGVMGLYDGIGNEKDNFSTAHLARVLDIPVILVVNAKAISTSIAAEVFGFKMFDERVNIKGVILNNVSSQKLYESLKEAVEKYTGIECLGYIPRNEQLATESRHLGLKQAFEEDNAQKQELFKEIAQNCLNLERIKEIAQEFESSRNMDNYVKIEHLKDKFKGKRVAIARDEAFSFYYEANIDLMKFCGVEIVEFSPIRDKEIPENTDFIYFGGGYPELFAKELSENISMKNSIVEACKNGARIFAECGGFMYLAKKLHLLNEEIFDMCGIFDIEIGMRKRLNIGRFGYINIETANGINLQGHEFHYSEILKNNEVNVNDSEGYFYNIYKNNGKEWKCGYMKNNAIAGYPHIHFYSNVEFLEFLLDVKRD